MTYEDLISRINSRQAVVGVIGLGYVGLPLAVEKAKAGYKVIGFDVQQSRVDKVNRGENYIGDVVDDELARLVSNGMLVATTDYSRIADTDCVAMCVPTPLDKHQQPDTSYVESSAKEVARYLHKGMLVVLESTTYPGTTEEILKPILESGGLRCGIDFYLAFSPERVDPGNKLYKIKNTPKVVGGVTPRCTEVAATLCRNVLDSQVHTVSSPAAAEMEKLLENVFRHVNIALANEMALLCNRMNVDVWEVIEAAATKPYGFMPFYPGPGLGGHCIPIDPFYLTWKAREFNYHTRLIELAGEINNSMPEYVVERLARILNKIGKPLRGSSILLLGVAYKRDIDDVRESPAVKILAMLLDEEADVAYNDPRVPNLRYGERVLNSVELSDERLASADAVVITTDHSDYDYERIVRQSSVVFDTRNATRGVSPRPNVFLL